MQITARKQVFTTPWFGVLAKTVKGEPEDAPYYCLTAADYVTVLPVTADGRIVAVRQFRPAVECVTLELPSGHVDAGETPEISGVRELREETGYRAGSVVGLGALWSDTGRMANRTWHFLAFDSTPDPDWTGPEPGVEPVVLQPAEFYEALRRSLFNHSLNVTSVLLALTRNERFRALSLPWLGGPS